MSRPNRSDAHLSPEEEARKAEEAREYFEEIAPKRHTKPQRSEYSSQYSDALEPSSDQEVPIPELDKFHHLQDSDPEKLVCETTEPPEEYVETEYYDDLNCIDKQHHTTGTGFIKVEKSNGGSFNLTLVSETCADHPHFKGNPATNEWIPSADTVFPVSHKPNRSDA